MQIGSIHRPRPGWHALRVGVSPSFIYYYSLCDSLTQLASVQPEHARDLSCAVLTLIVMTSGVYEDSIS